MSAETSDSSRCNLNGDSVVCGKKVFSETNKEEEEGVMDESRNEFDH
jgi:hypothetical protein